MKINILIVSLVCFAQVSFGQSSDRLTQRDELESQKIAFITGELKLTPEEAQNFWPLYNAYHAELLKLRKSERLGKLERRNADSRLSDKEIDAQIKQGFANDRHKIDLDEKYYEKFKTVLPVNKVADFYVAERNFKRELLKVLKDRRD